MGQGLEGQRLLGAAAWGELATLRVRMGRHTPKSVTLLQQLDGSDSCGESSGSIEPRNIGRDPRRIRLGAPLLPRGRPRTIVGPCPAPVAFP